MNREKVIELYKKEREYEESIFGDYGLDPNLNVASLILIIEESLKKAKKSYVSKWQYSIPDWLILAKESGSIDKPNTVPVKTYEELIKIFALAGAALEAFTEINPSLWRDNGIKEKWNK